MADEASTRYEAHATYQTTEVHNDNNVGVYIYKTGEGVVNTSDKYGYVDLHYNTNNGDLTLQSGTGGQYRTPYFPADKDQKIDIYVFAPRAELPVAYNTNYNSTTAELNSSTSVDFSVKTDQSAVADFMKSDFIWGSNINTVSAATYKSAQSASTTGYEGTGANTRILVKLYHQGSKIIVNLREGYSMGGKLAGAQVEIQGVKYTGKVNLKTGSMTPSATTGNVVLQSSLSSALTTKPANWPETLNPASYDDDNSIHKFYSTAAVVYPQEGVAASNFIKITLNDTNHTVYYASLGATATFVAKKQYIYNVTVDATAIQLTTTVENWDTAATENVNATY